jgi:dTMP kinase
MPAIEKAIRMSARHPHFITFEGVDGAGKSTHIEWFAEALRQRSGSEVILTREPGGTPLGESLRELLLHVPMHLETEALLMFAARRQHLADVIEPALARQAWVVCDRFTDATYAYQGAGRGEPRAKIDALRAWVHPHLEPGLTLLFDLDPASAQKRMDASRDKDRFEREALDFAGRVRAQYLRLADAEPDRYHVIDGARSVSDIRTALEEIITSLCLK